MPDALPSRPLARFDDLVISEANHDLLVYDQRSHHIHHLDEMSAATWRHCDGRHTIPDLARAVSQVLRRPVTTATIELALVKLSDVDLLATPVQATGPRESRRSLLRKAAIGGVVVPSIVSVSAPQAAMAVSTCAGPICADGCCDFGQCAGDGNCCLSGFEVCPTDGECCYGSECAGDGTCCFGGYPVCPTDGVCCEVGECDGDGNCCVGYQVCPTDGVCCDAGECASDGTCCRGGYLCDDGTCCNFGTCQGGICVF